MTNLSASVISALPQATANPGDYTEGGILHCGACGEPKEQIVSLLGSEHRMARECRCERTERETAEERDRLAKRAERAEQFRAECFPFDALRRMTFESDDMSNAKVSERCRRYADNFARAKAEKAGLLFYGSVGGGKTYHAASIANRVIDMGHSAIFTSIARISADMSAARFTGASKVLSDVMAHDLVILDDLGTERTTETAREQTNEIVDALSLSACVPIITTNMDIKAMQGETDPTLQRVYSRIFGMCQPVKVEHTDRRLEVGDGKADFYRSIW